MDKVSMRAGSPAILLLASLLAACGGGGGSSGSSSSSSSGGSGNTTDTVTLTATGSTAPVPSYANTDLDFTLTNTSSVAATNVTLAITLGTGLARAGLSCTASNGGACPSNLDSLTLVSLPANGSVRFRMSVIVAGGTTGNVTATANVTASNDVVTTNNAATISLTAYAADVHIAGSTSASDFASGSTVPYTLTVTNSGPDAARNVRLETFMSSGQVLQSMDCSATGGATCPATTGADITVPTLPSGGALIYTIHSRLSQDVLVSISSTMRATLMGDANFTNNATTVSALTRIPTSPDSPSFIQLTSDTGDYVGAGSDYAYSRVNAEFEVYALGEQLHVKVEGDEYWHAIFFMPAGRTPIATGTYTDLLGSLIDPELGGFTWGGQGRSCDSSGWWKIDEVVYAQGEIVLLDMRFEQHCSGGASALRGQIHWIANDATRPPGPVDPPPADLWAPAPGATPASGNYFYVESDPMDFVGQGATEVFTQVNSVLTVRAEADGTIGINAVGDVSYGGGFKAMSPLTSMAPGYYADVGRMSSGNPTRGRMSIGGNSRGCNVIEGWFVIDNIAFSGGDLIALDLRFEQHCEGNAPALRGRVHWRAGDPSAPPGPVVPPPANLWAPPASAIPATGNVVYLQSDAGDFIGGGLTAVYTPLDSIIDVGGGGMDPVGNRFQLAITGDQSWTGYFQAMNTLADVQAGYYGGLLRMGTNPVKGGLDWSGEGRGCNELSGWFVVDSVTYVGNSLDSIELRFEQHCEYSSAALRGYIRWSSSDTRQPLPPVPSAPAGLWDAPAGSTPATGNYLYLQSEPGSWVGRGETHLYTPVDAVFTMTVTNRQLNVEVTGDQRWGGYFAPMIPLDQLRVGYYGDLAANNIAKGTAYWYGEGRACGGTDGGWFMVDAVSYNLAGALTSLDLRFEHRCYPTEPAVRGKVRWRIDDPTQPPPPVNPPPAGLWSPPAGVIPATGNVFYIEGEAGDFVTAGQTLLYTSPGMIFQGGTGVNNSEAYVGVQNNSVAWAAHFKWMSSIPRLQVGYYPDVMGFPANPAKGMLSFSGQSRGCNRSIGWFVVDSVTYDGENMTSIDMRFEQHCEGAVPAARGRIRWSQ